MLEKQVTEKIDEYYEKISEKGPDAIFEHLNQSTQQIMVELNQGLQANLDYLTFEETSRLGKLIVDCVTIKNTLKEIETGNRDISEINKAKCAESNVYSYFIEVFSNNFNSHSVENKDYIMNNILLPLKMVEYFLKKW